MARLNAKRRRALALHKARQEFAQVLNPTTQASSGNVRSSTGVAKTHNANHVVPAVVRAFTPKPLNWDNRGVRGKVSRGKLVPPKKPDRWS